MYRKRTRFSKKLQAAMQAGRERARMARPAPEYHMDEIPELRREIIIIDHDFGPVEHKLELFKTNRRDCYRIVADGVEWKRRMGWSKTLEAVRKSFVRTGSFHRPL